MPDFTARGFKDWLDQNRISLDPDFYTGSGALQSTMEEAYEAGVHSMERELAQELDAKMDADDKLTDAQETIDQLRKVIARIWPADFRYRCGARVVGGLPAREMADWLTEHWPHVGLRA